jgi:hypothetical protein
LIVKEFAFCGGLKSTGYKGLCTKTRGSAQKVYGLTL